jgi:Amt family ammonium transporter
MQVVNQFLGSLIAWALAIVGTLIILKICDALIGLRVQKDEEMQGLDVSLHGEEGYILES